MNRNYIITGSSEGLGAALAKKLLLEGNQVFGISRRGNRELDQFGNFVDFKVDVTNLDDISSLFKKIVCDYPRLHGVVHAAAVNGPIGQIEDILPEDWAHAIQINLFGTYNLILNCAKYFREVKFGNFVALSGGGATSPMPRMTAYASSKTATVRLVESVARDFDDLPEVTFNSVAPGIMKTKMINEIIQAGPEMVGHDYHSRILNFQTNGTDSIEKAVDLISFLIASDGHGVTGKLLSAVWDDWSNNFKNSEYLRDREIHTLRRNLSISKD